MKNTPVFCGFNEKHLAIFVGHVEGACSFQITVRIADAKQVENVFDATLPVQIDPKSNKLIAVNEIRLTQLTPQNDVRAGNFEAIIMALDKSGTLIEIVEIRFSLNEKQAEIIRNELAAKAPAKVVPSKAVVDEVKVKISNLTIVGEGPFKDIAIQWSPLTSGLYRVRIVRLVGNSSQIMTPDVNKDHHVCKFGGLEEGDTYKVSVAGYFGDKLERGPWETLIFHVADGKLIAGRKPVVKPTPAPTPATQPATQLAVTQSVAPAQPTSAQNTKEEAENAALKKQVAELEAGKKALEASVALQVEEQVKIVKGQTENRLKAIQDRLDAEARQRAQATANTPPQPANQPATGGTTPATQATGTTAVAQTPAQPPNWWSRNKELVSATSAGVLVLLAIALMAWWFNRDNKGESTSVGTPTPAVTPAATTGKEIEELKMKIQLQEQLAKLKEKEAQANPAPLVRQPASTSGSGSSGKSHQSGNTVTAHTIIGVVNSEVKNSTIKILSSEVWTSEWRPTLPSVTCGVELQAGIEEFVVGPRDVQCVFAPQGWNIQPCLEDMHFIDIMCGDDATQRTYLSGRSGQKPMEITQFRFRVKAHINQDVTVRFKITAP